MKIFFIMLLIVIYIFVNLLVVHAKENINLNLKDKEIALTFINGNVFVSNKENILIRFNDNIEDVYKFGEYSVIDINELKSGIKDSIMYSIGNVLRIKYNSNTMCIIYNDIKQKISINDCNYIYILNINFNYLDINDAYVIFTHEKVMLPNFFIEDIYNKWIDIYKISNDEYTILKINDEDYQIVVINEQ